MSAIGEAVTRVLRGPRASRLLEFAGIDSKRYWLLMDLFQLLSERGEMLDQLGRNGVALKTTAWIYFGMSSLFSLLFAATRTDLRTYSSMFLLFTAFALLSILVTETANSLVNPVEGLVLAHQPISGATYTAAKLTHLGRVVFYLVPGLNTVPALAGLLLKGATWSFPLVHFLSAATVGLMAALSCCALFGWLMRFVPVRRLKAAGQLAGTLPLFGMAWMPDFQHMLAGSDIRRWLPAQAAARWSLEVAVGVAAVAIVILGIRSLSADYLIRVSSMVRGGPAAGATARRSRLGGLAARFCGGQASRAGFAFVSVMMRRDWQFRRQMIPMMALPAISLVSLYAGGLRADPFSGSFTPMHGLPHIFGIVLFFICVFLPYGDDYKGAWIFLLTPARALAGLARGTHAILWIEAIVIPHVAMVLLLAWFWGVWHAMLFAAYSIAVASVYLVLELRLIDGMPFSKQADPSRGAVILPMMIGGGFVIAIAVGLQYLLIFRSPVIVVLATAVLSVAAFLLTRSSLAAFEVSIRFNLALLSAEAGKLYAEVDS